MVRKISQKPFEQLPEAPPRKPEIANETVRTLWLCDATRDSITPSKSDIFVSSLHGIVVLLRWLWILCHVRAYELIGSRREEK